MKQIIIKIQNNNYYFNSSKPVFFDILELNDMFPNVKIVINNLKTNKNGKSTKAITL